MRTRMKLLAVSGVLVLGLMLTGGGVALAALATAPFTVAVASGASPVDPQATATTKQVLQYLYSLRGSHTLSGEYLRADYTQSYFGVQTTAQACSPNLPAMAGGAPTLDTAANNIRRAQQQWANGGLWVEMMGENQIGALGVPALKTAIPSRSNDFTFINDGRDKWGLGFLITADHVPGKRSAGSLSWGGIYNTYFWLDPARGIAGAILMQFLPFADPQALAVYDSFERGVYQLTGSA